MWSIFLLKGYVVQGRKYCQRRKNRLKSSKNVRKNDDDDDACRRQLFLFSSKSMASSFHAPRECFSK